MEETRLCGILVATETGNPAKIRVADLKNLKPQEAPYPTGYGEFDVDSKKYSGTHVVIVKRGQQAIFEGKVKVRFFMRVVIGSVVTGSNTDYAKKIAENAWNFRIILFDVSGPRWHEYFTKKQR